MLADLTAVERDVLLRIFAYVPMRAVCRLSATCKQLHDFIEAHELHIRSCLNIDISFTFMEFFGYSHNDDIRLATRKNYLLPYASYSFIVRRKSTYKHKDIKFMKKLADGVKVFKLASGRHVLILVPDNMPFEDAVRVSLEAFAKGFRFDKLRVRGDRRRGDLLDVVTNWLVKYKQRIEMLCLIIPLPKEDKLAAIMCSLGATSLEVYNDNHTWGLTSAFFRSIQLRGLKAKRFNCQITDEDLAHLDKAKIDDAQTALTASGIVAWVRRKLLAGKLGDMLMLQHEGQRKLVDVALGTLKKEFEFFEKPKGYFFFRGSGGRWLEIKYRFLLRIIPSYASCLIAKSLHKEKEPIGIEIRLDEGHTIVKLGDHQKAFVFELVKELPDDDWILLDQLTVDIFVYEKAFQHYVVHFQTAEQQDEALRLLGKKFHEKSFAKIKEFSSLNCESTPSDKAVDGLLKLLEEWPFSFPINNLKIRGPNCPMEKKLQQLIENCKVENADFQAMPGESWMLTTEFFTGTPTLRKFSLLDEGSSELSNARHFLGISDRELGHFTTFNAPNAETLISPTGIRDWLEQRHALAKEEYGERSIEILCPGLSASQLLQACQKLEIGVAEENAPKSSEPEKRIRAVFQLTDGRLRITYKRFGL